MHTAIVLSQGDEVITGQTLDTNATWLSERLVDLGLDVVRRVTVGDRLPDIAAELTLAARRADVVVCTGGLGPTDDDLTALACAEAFDRPLALDAVALAHIEAMYAAWGREMPASNRKQALLPHGADRLPNPVGTAPGFAFPAHGALVACLPGVPREMVRMWEDQVRPRIVARLGLHPGRLVVLRTTGVGESALQDRIGPAQAFAERGLVLGYRTMTGENQVKLRAGPNVPEAVVEAAAHDLVAAIGSPVFAVEGLDHPELPAGDLPTVVGAALSARGATLAVAESCTGGRVASLVTSVAGSSAWFTEGVVTYANAAKVARLGVPAALLGSHGAVSEPVARAMAEGVRAAAGTTYGLATTGVAGPGGGTEARPVGTVHLALAHPHGTEHRLVRLGGDRGRVQALAAHAALDLLRRHLSPPR